MKTTKPNSYQAWHLANKMQVHTNEIYIYITCENMKIPELVPLTADSDHLQKA
jgi:hypothetical protein